jgi:hypothetical protein
MDPLRSNLSFITISSAFMFHLRLTLATIKKHKKELLVHILKIDFKDSSIQKEQKIVFIDETKISVNLFDIVKEIVQNFQIVVVDLHDFKQTRVLAIGYRSEIEVLDY